MLNTVISPRLDLSEQRYKANVDSLARLNSNEIFENGMPLHAAIIFDAFFRHATKSVKIFCRNLSAEVFKEKWLLDSAKCALHKRGISISVLVKDQPQESEFRTWLQDNDSHPALVYRRRVGETNARAQVPFNFAVMDGKAYRFEPNEIDVVASACMNDPKISSDLERYYAQLMV